MTTNTTPEAEGEQLKPCPFCGQPPKEWVVPDFYSISCQSGSCPNPSTGSHITRKAAITAWNTRVTPPPAPTEPGTPRVYEIIERRERMNLAPWAELENAATQLERDLHAANRELAEARDDIGGLKDEIDVLRQSLDAVTAEMDELAKPCPTFERLKCGTILVTSELPKVIRVTAPILQQFIAEHNEIISAREGLRTAGEQLATATAQLAEAERDGERLREYIEAWHQLDALDEFDDPHNFQAVQARFKAARLAIDQATAAAREG